MHRAAVLISTAIAIVFTGKTIKQINNSKIKIIQNLFISNYITSILTV